MVSEVTATWQQLFEQGKHAYANNDLVNAEDLFKTAFEQARYSGAPEDALAEMSFNLGVCYHSKEDFFNAEKCYTQALFSAERAYGNESADVSTILRHLGSVYKQTNRAQEAKDVLSRADAIDSTSSDQSDEFIPPIQDPILSELGPDPFLDSAFPESASSKHTNRTPAPRPDDLPATLLLPSYEDNPTMSLPSLEHLSFPNQELHPRSPQSDLPHLQTDRPGSAYESRSAYDSGPYSPPSLPLPMSAKPQYPEPMKPQYPEPAKPQYPEPAKRPISQQSRRPGQPFVQKPAPGSTNNKLPARSSGNARNHESYDERVASAAQRTPQGYVDVDELVHPREKLYGSFSASFGWFIYGMSALLLVGLILAPLALLGSYLVGGLESRRPAQ